MGKGVCLFLVVLAFFTLALSCANPREPRLLGKYAVLEQVKQHLPHAYLKQWLGGKGEGEWEENAPLSPRVVIKPNAFTCRGRGVKLVEEVGALPLPSSPSSSQSQSHPPLLFQELATGSIEARVYGTRSACGSGEKWQFDPLVGFASKKVLTCDEQNPQVEMYSMPTALKSMLSSALDKMQLYAVAIDVKAESWDALLSGSFKILEINGCYGFPHTWRGRGLAAFLRDAWRWWWSRVWLGLRNTTNGTVDAGERLLNEIAWLRGVWSV